MLRSTCCVRNVMLDLLFHINIHGWWGGPAPKTTPKTTLFWQNLCFRATLEHFCSFTKMYDFSESSFSTNTTALLLFFQFIRFIPKLVFEEHQSTFACFDSESDPCWLNSCPDLSSGCPGVQYSGCPVAVQWLPSGKWLSRLVQWLSGKTSPP